MEVEFDEDKNISRMDGRQLFALLASQSKLTKGGTQNLLTLAKKAGLKVSERSTRRWIKILSKDPLYFEKQRRKNHTCLLNAEEKMVVIGWVRSENLNKRSVEYQGVKNFIENAFQVKPSAATIYNYCLEGGIVMRKCCDSSADKNLKIPQLACLVKFWLQEREIEGFFNHFSSNPSEYLCLDYISDTRRRVDHRSLSSKGKF